MYTELPRITRCCFCIPLRYGLLVWAYIKLMFCLFVIFVIVMRNAITQSQSLHTMERIIEIVVGVAFLIEITITMVFIVGAHKKNPKLLRIYYGYTVVIVTLIFILNLLAIGADMYAWVMFHAPSMSHLHDVIQLTIITVGSLIFNLYQLALIKNEIRKLENNHQISFTNDVTDLKCIIQSIEREPNNA